MGEERVEEGAVGCDGAGFERVALVEDAAVQVEGFARREGLVGAGLPCALRMRAASQPACDTRVGFVLRSRT